MISFKELFDIIKDFAEVLIALALLVVLCVSTFKRHKESKLHNEITKELLSYAPASQEYEYSGNISCSGNVVVYARGNREAEFNIPLEKHIKLAPSLISVWFTENKYDSKEANVILNDIAHFLTEHKLCKTASIISDEDYETGYSEISDDTDDVSEYAYPET